MIAVLWNFVIKISLMAGSLFFAIVAGFLGLCLFYVQCFQKKEATSVLEVRSAVYSQDFNLIKGSFEHICDMHAAVFTYLITFSDTVSKQVC